MRALCVKNFSAFLVTENLNFCSVVKLSKIHLNSLYSLQSLYYSKALGTFTQLFFINSGALKALKFRVRKQ